MTPTKDMNLGTRIGYAHMLRELHNRWSDQVTRERPFHNLVIQEQYEKFHGNLKTEFKDFLINGLIGHVLSGKYLLLPIRKDQIERFPKLCEMCEAWTVAALWNAEADKFLHVKQHRDHKVSFTSQLGVGAEDYVRLLQMRELAQKNSDVHFKNCGNDLQKISLSYLRNLLTRKE